MKTCMQLLGILLLGLGVTACGEQGGSADNLPWRVVFQHPLCWLDLDQPELSQPYVKKINREEASYIKELSLRDSNGLNSASLQTQEGESLYVLSLGNQPQLGHRVVMSRASLHDGTLTLHYVHEKPSDGMMGGTMITRPCMILAVKDEGASQVIMKAEPPPAQ